MKDQIEIDSMIFSLWARIAGADTKDAHQCIARAEALLNQIESGEKSPRLLSTVESLVQDAEKINRIMAE